MKICKNCSSTNTSDATKCKTCGMKGMLVDEQSNKNQTSTIKIIYDSCNNCGTTETGTGSKCAKCNFPKRKKIDTDQAILANPKVKRS